MIIPLVNAKLLLSKSKTVDLFFLESSPMNAYKFKAKSHEEYIELKQLIQPDQFYEFLSTFNGKLYRWKAIINYFIDQDNCLIAYNPIVYDIQNDLRKERLGVIDTAFITDMKFNGQNISLYDKSIPTISQDISESGILIFTKLDLTEILKYEDNEITVNFQGNILSELGQKKIKIKRIFADNNNYYYGCEFQVNDFQDLKQINKIIQQLKLK